VTCFLNQLFQINIIVTKSQSRFTPTRRNLALQFIWRADNTHTTPTTTPAGFQHQRVANTACNFANFFYIRGQNALRIARYAKYECAGTVEFLMDKRDGRFYFIEVNPRVQVEHTITEEVTGIDIVKAQIRLAEGAIIGDEVGCGVPIQENISLHGHALQCRVTTEDPLNGFVPDYGRITRGVNVNNSSCSSINRVV
jgi:hypothetical protein